jgi:lysyl-tRNA synthetase class 2
MDLRYRQRYVDLIVTPGVKEVFIQRTAMYRAIREFLDGRGFLEVETPILQPLYGGAAARPFKTFHNTLGIQLYLRIADELYLKRLIVGGYERVYEFCKDFRNEGMDRFHNPEFSMLELYWAYHDYRDVMKLVKELFVFVAEKVLGTLDVPHQGGTVSLAGDWKEIALLDSIREATGLDCLALDEKTLASSARGLGLEIPPNANWGALVDLLFAEKVQPGLSKPTFVIDYPVEISPLAKRHRSNPRLTERFELFLAGLEMANAFSELNDPIDQRKRFEQQLALKEKGDEGAHVLDEDFLRALEYGMPPAGGLGIGLDRWVMFLTDQPSIRDVIFFPQMRPEGSQ